MEMNKSSWQNKTQAGRFLPKPAGHCTVYGTTDWMNAITEQARNVTICVTSCFLNGPLKYGSELSTTPHLQTQHSIAER